MEQSMFDVPQTGYSRSIQDSKTRDSMVSKNRENTQNTSRLGTDRHSKNEKEYYLRQRF